MKQNYGKYSKQGPKQVEEVAPEEVTETIDPIAVESVQLEVEQEEESVVNVPEPKIGVVNCSQLNVRKFPGLNAAVIGIVQEHTEIKVIPDQSTADWYKVETVFGEGYCMKKFISIK